MATVNVLKWATKEIGETLYNAGSGTPYYAYANLRGGSILRSLEAIRTEMRVESGHLEVELQKQATELQQQSTKLSELEKTHSAELARHAQWQRNHTPAFIKLYGIPHESAKHYLELKTLVGTINKRATILGNRCRSLRRWNQQLEEDFLRVLDIFNTASEEELHRFEHDNMHKTPERKAVSRMAQA
ncbi:hypothetical protein B9Z19DRAFT_1145234 [Tuber borchii]|uniref:Uncharacterized protein n=1 Tax=Tuber borchii TaxID=42251 RepID=A0A2T6ZQ70_TUBBO|nr:hypothetical protein B9Z19DRAFT_1145234 [Tuber borchii]